MTFYFLHCRKYFEDDHAHSFITVQNQGFVFLNYDDLKS